MKMNLESEFKKLVEENDGKVMWKKITKEGLDVDYAVIIPKALADELLMQLEETVEYFSGELTKVKVFGKYHEIPRQQVAYGDEGLKYSFSGVTVPARSWIGSVKAARDLIASLTGYDYNFVLVNRDGSDHIGEHRDNEPDMDENTPIASLSLGQQREFVLKHGDVRRKGVHKRNIPLVKIELEHGSVLLMNPLTNKYWYHSLPQRKRANRVRVNLTFRKILSNN